MKPHFLNFQNTERKGYGFKNGVDFNVDNPINEHYNSHEEFVKYKPLTYAQKRLWFLSQINEIAGTYNLIHTYETKGILKLHALEQSISKIISRHEALRATFVKKDDEVLQKISASNDFKLESEDITKLNPKGQKQKIVDASLEMINHRFDLSLGPLIKVIVLRINEDTHRLFINMHHIISDGWSFEIFKKELSVFYEATISKNEEPTLPEINHEPATELDETQINQQLTYWKTKLKGLPELLELPSGKTRPNVQTYKGKRFTYTLDKPLVDKLRQLSFGHNSSLYVCLMSAFKVLISRYTGRQDIVIGSPFAGRQTDHLRSMIGFYVKTMVLRSVFDDHSTFENVLKNTNENVLGAFENQDIPFDKLVEELKPERNPSFSPLFQIMFVFQNEQQQLINLPELQIKQLHRDFVNAKFDLTLEINNQQGGLVCSFDFNTDVYDEEMIKGLGMHYKTLLESIISNPEKPIAELQILSDKELDLITHQWNKTNMPFPANKCLHHLFEAQVKKKPGGIALIYKDQSLSYEQVNEKVNQLARHLIHLGIKQGDFVGIQIDRSFEMVLAVLAVLKSGAAYVAIDPNYPEERQKFMLEDAGIAVLLTTSDIKEQNQFSWENTKFLLLNEDWDTIVSTYSKSNPNIEVSPNDLAYMIYTSGSTGKPKGVMIEHKGLPNLIIDHIRKYELKPGSCVLQFASLSFDASICEIGMALNSGATLCIAKKDDILPGPGLIKLLNDKKITHVTLPPSALSILPQATLPFLKVITVTGEACPEILIDQWANERKFFNGYGPSEVTIGATISDFSQSTKKTSIGRPFANYKIYILDKNLQPVPVGIPGEIYIGGIGLARGYHQREKLTEEKFIQNPFGKPGEKIYKTGDLARYLSTGEIDFIGRIDNMVKLRGMRIELGEIESVINSFKEIKNCKIVVRDDISSQKQLVAYYISSKVLNERKLRSRTSDQLPKHMVPSFFVQIDEFPLSPNGKIDVKLLPLPKASKADDEAEGIAPRNEIEKILINIWRKVLGTEKIGVTDNFFDLGGHSLIAVSMVTEIDNTLQTKVPVSTLMQKPTIEDLALFINQGENSDQLKSTIVPIKEGGSNPPLFLMHTPSGHILSYYKLAGHMNPDQPVYGIQVRDHHEDKKPYHSIEAMASYYADEILKFKPYGPYHLGGYCFGGLIAYEVAIKLKEKKADIGQIFLIGSQFPDVKTEPEKICEAEGEVQNDPALVNCEGIPEEPLLSKFVTRSNGFKKRILKKLMIKVFNFYKRNNFNLPIKLRDYKLIHSEALKNHTPGHCSEDIILILPSTKTKQETDFCRKTWETIVSGKIKVLKSSGNQGNMLSDPHAIELASLITKTGLSTEMAKQKVK